MNMRTNLLRLAGIVVIFTFTSSSAQEPDAIDRAVVARVRAEASQRSSITENASTLTDMYGARLTGSNAFAAAADWARSRLQSYGASNVRLERFP